MSPSVNYPFQLFACILMLVAFVCLAIGTSFLGVERQKQAISKTTSKNEADESEKASTPFENTTEEKMENSPNTFYEEYLREDIEHFLNTDIPLKHNKYPDPDAFVNFCGESVSQPPESLSW